MAKLNTSQIIQLHDAGLDDALIDKLVEMSSDTHTSTQASKPNGKNEEQPETRTVSDILSGFFNEEKPKDDK